MSGSDAARRPHVIILNGVSSVGKSSVARALQDLAAEPFLHVAMDTFLDMAPGKLFGAPEGMIFERTQDNGRPVIHVRTGAVVERTLRGMRRAVAAMAAEGNNLVVDEVMFGGGEAADYAALLTACDLRFVGLFAPLEVIEARERARGDRDIGLARGQYDRVHQGVTYDLTLDTTTMTATACAEAICRAFGL